MPRHRFTDTRERIEKAAIRLFVEKGVTETSVRDIARAVDISEGALYRNFVRKDELAWAVFERLAGPGSITAGTPQLRAGRVTRQRTNTWPTFWLRPSGTRTESSSQASAWSPRRGRPM